MASDRLRRDRNEKIVILDSSAIIMLFEFSIDLEDEITRLVGKHHTIVPKPVFNELEFLSEHGKGKKRMFAKASLKLIQRYDIEDISSDNADDGVFRLAQKTNGVVVTNDKELRKRLKKIPVPVVFLRGRKKLVVE
jgi:rRNA-processing protein FCF1